MRVLFVTVAPSGQCSLGYAIGVLNFQMSVRAAPHLTVDLDVAPSLQAAIAKARSGTYDALVAIHSNIAFSPSLVLRGLTNAECPFVVGVYPHPSIDWKRVTLDRGSAGEDLKFKGNTYNLDPTQARMVRGGYLATKYADLGVVVLRDDALANVSGSTDKDVCASWGRDIYADLDNPCSLTGQVEFTGCVGMRSILR